MLGRGMVAPVVALLLLLPASARTADDPPPNLPACPSSSASPDPALLLQRVEQMLEGTSSVATISMSIKTKSWSRKLKMKVWTRGEELALVRILEGGPRETGMMTLKRGKQLWNYLPQAGRVMKLPSGMLGDSWMGSDFTNDDLVNGTSLVDDFDSKVVGTSTHEGHGVWRLVLIPKPSSTVVWGKVEMLVDRATCLPLIDRFYDEDGQLARTMTFAEVKTIGWRQFPSRVTVKPADAARETVVSYGDLQFDVSIPDETFSLHRLQQGR